MPCTRDLEDIVFMVRKMEACKVPGVDLTTTFREVANRVMENESHVIVARDDESIIGSGVIGSILDFFGVRTFWIHFIWAREQFLEPLKDDIFAFCSDEGINRISGIMKKNYNAAMRKYGFFEDGLIVSKNLKEG